MTNQVISNWKERATQDMERVQLMLVPPPTILALLKVAEAAQEEHGWLDHEPECALCVAMRELEAL